MKHNIKITIILLSMFIITQLIGIYVVNFYSPVKIVDGKTMNVTAPELPYGFQPPELKENRDFNFAFISILFAFIIAVSLLFLLTQFNAEFFLRLWFFIVVTIALGISFNVFLFDLMPFSVVLYSFPLPFSWTIASLLALPLAFVKIYKRKFLIHNFTELFIYPGIAAVFVPILNVFTIIFLLVFISIYDMWAVWHSGIMQKMAKYQINKLNIFSGFFVPYISKELKLKLQKMKSSSKSKSKIKVNVAILGGGDIVFPIITAGVMLKTLGLASAFLVIAGAALGLAYLFFFSEKKKFYPAMPFISAGIFLGILVSYLIL